MLPIIYLLPLAAAANVYTNYSEAAFQALQGWYNETSGLWDTCGWWNGANCMTVIADLAASDTSVLSSATSVFAHTYTAAPNVNPSTEVLKVIDNNLVKTEYGTPPHTNTTDSANTVNVDGFLDSCYDDNGWWALAWIGAYDLTQNADYLDTAVGIFDNMTGAGPTNCSNGGIVWCADNYYVNAIANELFLSVGAHLANRVPSNSSYYISKAQDQWTWFQSSGLINSQNLINDGLEANCTNSLTREVYSYNQGVILGALVELNKASPDSALIDSANTLATAAIANLTDSNHIVHDQCEPDCAPDGTQFKGVFMRNLAALQAASPSDTYSQVIQANADSIWANDRDTSNNTFSVDWAGPFVAPVNASTHSSAMDALVAAISLGG